MDQTRWHDFLGYLRIVITIFELDRRSSQILDAINLIGVHRTPFASDSRADPRGFLRRWSNWCDSGDYRRSQECTGVQTRQPGAIFFSTLVGCLIVVIGVVYVSLHLNLPNGGKPSSSTDYRWHAVMCVLWWGSDWEFPAVRCCCSVATRFSYTS
jgi:hypothetical protein